MITLLLSWISYSSTNPATPVNQSRIYPLLTGQLDLGIASLVSSLRLSCTSINLLRREPQNASRASTTDHFSDRSTAGTTYLQAPRNKFSRWQIPQKTEITKYDISATRFVGSLFFYCRESTLSVFIYPGPARAASHPRRFPTLCKHMGNLPPLPRPQTLRARDNVRTGLCFPSP